MRTKISEYVSRGYVEVRIDFEDKREKDDLLDYDKGLAKNYLRILNQMEKDLGETISNKMEYVIKYPNMITKSDSDTDEKLYSEVILKVLTEALEKLVEMRTQEGMRKKDYFICFTRFL